MENLLGKKKSPFSEYPLPVHSDRQSGRLATDTFPAAKREWLRMESARVARQTSPPPESVISGPSQHSVRPRCGASSRSRFTGYTQVQERREPVGEKPLPRASRLCPTSFRDLPGSCISPHSCTLTGLSRPRIGRCASHPVPSHILPREIPANGTASPDDTPGHYPFEPP
jgi:hypothetical protein